MAAPLKVRTGTVEEGEKSTYLQVGNSPERWCYMDEMILVAANRHAARNLRYTFDYDDSRSPFFEEPLRG